MIEGSLHIDIASAHIAQIVVRPWEDATSGHIPEEVAQAVVANAVDARGRRRTMVQFEQITGANWQNAIAFRPGIGWRRGRDASLHDVYIPFDVTEKNGLGAIDQASIGRWIPVVAVGRIID